MTDEELDGLLERIDAAVGVPEDETPGERAARKAMVGRDAEARRIRRAALDGPGGRP